MSSFDIGLWTAMLLFVLGVTGASLAASLLAVPGLVAALVLLVVLMTHPRWN